MKLNQAAESLAKTDDMLAVLGFIMLAGVFISSYGSLWQGRLAEAEFKGRCVVNPKQQQQIEDKKTTRFIVVMSVIGVITIGLIIYILKKRIVKSGDGAIASE